MASQAPAGALSLIVYHRNGAMVVPLAESMVVGRQQPSDIVIDDASLSRQHARFTPSDDGAIVEDLGSTNGTRYRGRRATKHHLAAEEQVLLGWAQPVAEHSSRSPPVTSC